VETEDKNAKAKRAGESKGEERERADEEDKA
jgi:hypothetical protein